MEAMDTVTEQHKQLMISSFVDIVCGQSAATAARYLRGTHWNLERAIGLYYMDSERSAAASTTYSPPDQSLRHQAVWAAGQSVASTDGSQDTLASMYRPPLHLMHNGSFQEAKDDASFQDKWLIINVQSNREFNSHALNRDTWANDAVAETVKANFIFWQIYEDLSEGKKVCTFYKLDKIPAVLVIDPITGQKLRSWYGAIDPEGFLEDLYPYVDSSPKASLSHKRPKEPSSSSSHKIEGSPGPAVKTCEVDEEIARALAESLESMTAETEVNSLDGEVDDMYNSEEETLSEEKPVYPHLPEEPVGDKSSLCRVGIRLPDGCRVQRNFLKTDSIQLLWSLGRSLLAEEDQSRTFGFTQGMASGSKSLEYKSNLTFEESGLSNSLISLAWD